MADTPGLNYIRLDHNPLPLVVISCALSDKGIYERFVGNEQRASTMSRLRNGTRRARSPTSVTGIPRRRIFLPSSRTSAQIRVMAIQASGPVPFSPIFNLLGTVAVIGNVCLDSHPFIPCTVSEGGPALTSISKAARVDEPLVTGSRNLEWNLERNLVESDPAPK